MKSQFIIDAKKLMDLYNITSYMIDGISDAIDRVDSLQAVEICDSTKKYKDLEKIRIYLYYLYIKNILKNKKNY